MFWDLFSAFRELRLRNAFLYRCAVWLEFFRRIDTGAPLRKAIPGKLFFFPVSLAPPCQAHLSRTDTGDAAHDAKAAVEEVEEWRNLSYAWMSTAESGKEPKKVPKPQRLAALSWISAIDHALMTNRGCGLGFWSRLPLIDALEGRCRLRGGPDAVLTLGADNGSDGFAARQFLKYKFKLMLVDFEDIMHGVNCDLRCGLETNKALINYMFMNGLVYNWRWGPWRSSEWHGSVMASTRKFINTAGFEDSLFQSFLPDLADMTWTEKDIDDKDVAKRPKGIVRGQMGLMHRYCRLLSARGTDKAPPLPEAPETPNSAPDPAPTSAAPGQAPTEKRPP